MVHIHATSIVYTSKNQLPTSPAAHIAATISYRLRRHDIENVVINHVCPLGHRRLKFDPSIALKYLEY